MKSGFVTNAVYLSASLVVLLALAYAPIRSARTEENRGFARAIDLMQRRGLSDLDKDAMVEGYYEGLLDQSSRSTSTGQALLGMAGIVRATAPPTWIMLPASDAVDWDESYLRYRLKPNLRTTFKETDFVTNRWRQRDLDYALEKPPGTWRIAIVGASITMGSGVPGEGCWENLLEERLNADHTGRGIDRYEVINFSVAGYRLTQQLDVVLEQVPPFQVDVIVLVANELTVNPHWSKHLINLAKDRVQPKYDFLADVLAQAKVSASQRPSTLAARLAPFRNPVLRACLERIQESARQTGARLVVLQLPMPTGTALLRERLEYCNQVVGELKIDVVDLLTTFDEVDNLEELWLRPWDQHPNAAGHRMIYEHLYRVITDDPVVGPLMLGGTTEDEE